MCVFAFQTVTPLGFRVGMKMEAVDKKKLLLICVSSVRDMVDSRLLVHFDNLDENYDWSEETCFSHTLTHTLPLTLCYEQKEVKVM